MTALALQNRVLSFWFHGTFDKVAAGTPLVFRMEWFQRSDELDRQIRDNFQADLEQVVEKGQYVQELRGSPKGVLSLIILMDQFSRNIYRNSPLAFKADPKALTLAKLAVNKKWDLELHPIERTFAYMPFEHSEAMEDQKVAVQKFTEMAKANPSTEALKMGQDYAIKHLEVIEKFGRFPHRNQVLGRTSTEEELKYLADGGGF
ncbi:hypothetical protein H4R33_004263 [Dimargaris cristalligena]|nr:hypothetical protein H4R33_004263 [Dimargaris cristalligena]